MKWLFKIARLGLVVVMVTLLTVLTTGYVVNTYIQALLGSYNLPMASQTPSLGGMIKGMLGFGTQSSSDQKDSLLSNDSKKQDGLKASEGLGSEVSGQSDGTERDSSFGGTGVGNVDASKAAERDGDGQVDKDAGRGGSSSNGDAQDAQDAHEEAPEGSVPVMGGIAGESAGAGQDQQVLVTPDDLLAKKDELSDQEKEEVFATLMSKLPQEEMLKMSELIEGGLTETEMIQIEQILSKHLSKEEYSNILKLLKK